MSGTEETPKRPGPPHRQDNLERAANLGYAALHGQTPEQAAWLGAEPATDGWRLPVFGDVLHVDPAAGRITTAAGEQVGLSWAILVLHYLAIDSQPAPQEPNTIFADLSNARTYASVYQGRVIARLCATAGRDAQTLRAAAEALEARAVEARAVEAGAVEAGAVEAGAVEAGDLAFDFRPFPRITLRLVWHAPDEEFPPSATLLLPGNIESFLCSEDIVVMSESLVARLGGRPF